MRVRLKIVKKTSGTYAIESLSIKQLRELNKLTNKRRWEISARMVVTSTCAHQPA